MRLEADGLEPDDLGSRAYDVFLSYNGEDEVEITAVATRLRDRGFSVWFAPWNLVAPVGSLEEA